MSRIIYRRDRKQESTGPVGEPRPLPPPVAGTDRPTPAAYAGIGENPNKNHALHADYLRQVARCTLAGPHLHRVMLYEKLNGATYALWAETPGRPEAGPWSDLPMRIELGVQVSCVDEYTAR